MNFTSYYKSIYHLSATLAILTTVGCTEGEISESDIQPLNNPWEFAIPNQKIPEGLSSLSSEQCGICHQKHYEEWRFSTHSHAWTDLQFQAELKKESSPFMCINCHIPLQNQQEFIVTGLIDGDIYQPVKEKNPHFDPKLQREGINCVSCHVRNNMIVGPTGTSKAPHKTVKDTEFLSERLCISCHNANAVITPTLACTFQTGDEWKAGPYFGEKNCIDCHMDTISREIVPGFGKRLSRYHYFAGSGIPKFDSVETKILNGLEFYPSPLKANYKRGEEIAFDFKVINEHAGHRVPTGDPERFFIFSFDLINDDGDTLATQTNRVGEEWEWYPEAKKNSDTNINPLEERHFGLTFIPEKKVLLTLHVVVTKHRLNQESAEYNELGDDYPLFITIFDERYQMAVK